MTAPLRWTLRGNGAPLSGIGAPYLPRPVAPAFQEKNVSTYLHYIILFATLKFKINQAKQNEVQVLLCINQYEMVKAFPYGPTAVMGRIQLRNCTSWDAKWGLLMTRQHSDCHLARARFGIPFVYFAPTMCQAFAEV